MVGMGALVADDVAAVLAMGARDPFLLLMFRGATYGTEAGNAPTLALLPRKSSRVV